MSASFFAELRDAGHRVVGFYAIDAKDGKAGEAAKCVRPFELGKEVFRRPFPVHFIFRVHLAARFFIVGSVEDDGNTLR